MDRSIGGRIAAAWRWLPVLIRAPLIAFVVLNVGSTVGVVPVFANTKVLPGLPWALPVTALLMWAFWLYCTGSGYPTSTRAARRSVTRSRNVPWPIWRAALPALVVSIVTMSTLRLILPSILPVEPPSVSLDLAALPGLTTVGLLLSVALTAGVAEELAFRGYLQKPLEERLGLLPAILVTGIAFWLAHADKVSLSHLPFHLAASVFLGLTAYLTRSLLPSIVGHALADALLLPAYAFHRPASLWLLLHARPLWEGMPITSFERIQVVARAMAPTAVLNGPTQSFAVVAWLFVASLPAAVWAYFRLARLTANFSTNRAPEQP